MILKLILRINILVWYRYMKLWCKYVLVTIYFKIYSSDNHNVWDSGFKTLFDTCIISSRTYVMTIVLNIAHQDNKNITFYTNHSFMIQFWEINVQLINWHFYENWHIINFYPISIPILLRLNLCNIKFSLSSFLMFSFSLWIILFKMANQAWCRSIQA